MRNVERVIESVSIMEKLAEGTKHLLEQMRTLTESVVPDFGDLTEYEEFKLLAKQGILEAEYRNYTMTQRGQEMLEDNDWVNKNPKEYKKMLKENAGDAKYMTIKYKMIDEEKDLIEDAEARFELTEDDNLPVVSLTAENYSGLLNRSKGQHWRQYLGEEGRQLIRQKKLGRFYVQNEDTGRRYLYIVPK
jgi:hypothetical protein